MVQTKYLHVGKRRGIPNVLDGVTITSTVGIVRGHGSGMIVRHPYVPLGRTHLT
jgi:hypothetical protein